MTKLIAHRGASAEAPENTIIAFQKAITLGVDYIEFDVRLTKEGIPVVIHDASVTRTTNYQSTLSVHNLTLPEIRKLDFGRWFGSHFANEKIPTLEEVLKLEFKDIGLMIEVKKDKQPPSEIVNTVAKVIENSPFDVSHLKIGSFSVPIVQELQKRFPTNSLIGIIEKANAIEEFIKLDIKHLAISYKLITPYMISSLHENNIEIWTFTVDNPKTASSLIANGIDGIITNNPRRKT